VLMYGIDKKELSDLSKGLNTKYFGNKKMVGVPAVCDNFKDVVNFKPDYVVIAVPSIFIEKIIKDLSKQLTNKPVFINVAKGFDPKTNDV
ncbi:MAG: hypothetical protein K2M43_00725, partial [Mycoplasmoidaceae bacterium]|nr:hypothetical protein [Mycoplasmoidaceae bacterium]